MHSHRFAPWGRTGFLSLLLTIATLRVSVVEAQATPPSSDWSAVEQALGRKGTPNPGDVVKFSFPRSDMVVSVGGVQLKPALALGSWVAFKHAKGGTIAMGDLGLAESE